jgi:NADH-ubiquinone oxidoreductase chain 4
LAAIALQSISLPALVLLALISCNTVLRLDNSLAPTTQSVILLSYSPISRALVLLSILTLALMLTAKPLIGAASARPMRAAVLLTVVLLITFLTDHPILFYVSFELSLLPIFTMIMGWGYQPERLNAGISLLLYTMTSSLPLLLIIMGLSLHASLLSFQAIV